MKCSVCGKDCKPYGHKDDWIDREEYDDHRDEYSNYPHTFAGDEVHIYFPICKECFLVE